MSEDNKNGSGGIFCCFGMLFARVVLVVFCWSAVKFNNVFVFVRILDVKYNNNNCGF